MDDDGAGALRGAKLQRVVYTENRVHVTVSGGETVTFSTERRDGDCVLTVERSQAEASPEGAELMTDAWGRTIVRVREGGDRVSLHLDDGELFHVLAVVNEDGCRVATREEREHGRGVRSVPDRLLGRLRGGSKE